MKLFLIVFKYNYHGAIYVANELSLTKPCGLCKYLESGTSSSRTNVMTSF